MDNEGLVSFIIQRFCDSTFSFEVIYNVDFEQMSEFLNDSAKTGYHLQDPQNRYYVQLLKSGAR